MKFIKRLLCTILCVVILSLSVGTKYFDSSHIEKVEAVGEIALGLDVMYALCEYIGSAFLGYSCASSMPQLTSDDVAELGHSLSCAMFGFDSIFEPNDPIIAMLDSTGQQYVFGSEALEETARTSFTVIQGGKNNDDDDEDEDDNEDSNIIHFPKNHTDLKKFFTLSFTGATAIAKVFPMSILSLLMMIRKVYCSLLS